MESPDEGAARGRSELDAAEQARVSANAREDARHLQDRLRRLAAEVGRTENEVAATYQRLAAQALQQGRVEDARRLEGEATAALRAAAHERREIERWPTLAEEPRQGWARADDQRVAARDVRNESAGGRDEAAGLRDTAAGQRDEFALDRDLRAADRDHAADRRQAAADERAVTRARRAHRTPTVSGPMAPAAIEEQSAIDAEMEETFREQAADDREAAAADREVDAADRAQAMRDRLAAARDRTAARADREQAELDRMADRADDEQAEIERQSTS